MESPFYNNLYNNLVPTIEPMNRQIIKHQAESDIHAAALKKALMLQPPAIAAPYPIRHPPIQLERGKETRKSISTFHKVQTEI